MSHTRPILMAVAKVLSPYLVGVAMGLVSAWMLHGVLIGGLSPWWLILSPVLILIIVALVVQVFDQAKKEIATAHAKEPSE